MSGTIFFKYPKKNYRKLCSEIKKSKYYFGTGKTLGESMCNPDSFIMNYSCIITLSKKGYGSIDYWASMPKITVEEVNKILTRSDYKCIEYDCKGDEEK